MRENIGMVKQRRKRELKLEYENRKPLFLVTREEKLNWWNGINQNFTGRTIEDLREEYYNEKVDC
jgi:hypothetical protein